MSAKITKATNSVMNFLLKIDNLLLVVGKKIL